MQLLKLSHWAVLASLIPLFTSCSKPEEEVASTPVEVVSSIEADLSPAKEAATTAAGFETVDQQASYGMGYGMGANIARQGVVKADLDALFAGLKDGLASVAPQLDEATLRAAFSELDSRVASEAKAQSEANLATSVAFLEKNAVRPDVTVTASGLQYEVLDPSENPEARKPTTTDKVKVHYHGTLINGTVFDSSVQRGEPLTIPVAGVISGWAEALQLMSIGEKWKITVPPALGYGAEQTGGIPGNSALIFEIELIAIEEE
ncbi:FKBP-type peptidyl-prolyl cis-trans isomerase [Puniceicoccales bacterium CK1056]|uniref:Peptidyl-prolyl cis-trans isomerase n=2 Tax=Oceanipulchritudo coccoides TaxID=2706888 RepID=A0A6B2M1E8_9BACT|nr:FKBP-type peptidyl-prolyl cis-trans isomerase [Oceanipulchritudo coccoides]